MTYTPETGDIIKMHSWHGVVLEKFKSEAGKTILRVQTARNVFRKLGPEFIEVDLAPDLISPATLEDLQAEMASHQKVQQSAIEALTNLIRQKKSV